MAQIANSDFKVGMVMRGIELLHGSLNLPNVQNVTISNFNFNITVETKSDAAQKLVFVVVGVEIRNDDQSLILGSISVSCIYEIVNFEEVIKISADGTLEIAEPLVEILNSVSISTVRGVMFSTFKGTFLHNAILPILDPKQIQISTPDVK